MSLARCACGREWSGLSQAHCSVCHEHFSTVDNFDRHRPSYSGCKRPAEMRNGKGEPFFQAVQGRFGTTWARLVQGTPPRTVIPGGTSAHA